MGRLTYFGSPRCFDPALAPEGNKLNLTISNDRINHAWHLKHFTSKMRFSLIAGCWSWLIYSSQQRILLLLHYWLLQYVYPITRLVENNRILVYSLEMVHFWGEYAVLVWKTLHGWTTLCTQATLVLSGNGCEWGDTIDLIIILLSLWEKQKLSELHGHGSPVTWPHTVRSFTVLVMSRGHV